MDFLHKNATLYIPDGAADGMARTTDLCIAAHADDVEIMCYGAIAACFDSETRCFGSVTVTDGAGSPRVGVYAAMSDEEMTGVRAAEQRRAADLGRYAASVQLGFSSAAVKARDDAVTAELARLLPAARADTVYIHNLFDKHDTHVATALATIDALRRVKDRYRAKRVYMLEVWRSLDWLCDGDKTLFDTTPHPTLARDILAVYESQIMGGKRYDLAALGRRLANATFFESHETDTAESLSYGLDATDFVYSDRTAAEFVNEYIDRFCAEVRARLKRLGD